MSQFRFRSTVVPVLRDDIDTDQIIPARFLTTTTKTGLGAHLFADWRRREGGGSGPPFILDDPRHEASSVLLAGRNFGAGSSREHAPWALLDHGFRAVVARSFADIFAGNALKNGLLVIPLEGAPHQRLGAALEADPEAKVAIDLEAQTIALPAGETVTFPIDAFAKHMLLNGLDELTYLARHDAEITAFEVARGEGGAASGGAT